MSPLSPYHVRGLRRAALALILGLLGGLVSCADTAPIKSGSPALRPPVLLTAEVDTPVATTGDVITYEVTLDRDPEIDVQLPEIFSKIQGFKVTDIQHKGPVTRDGRAVQKKIFKLRAFEVGSYILPELQISYKDKQGETQTAGAPQIFVEIKSVLEKKEEAQEITDIKPVLVPPVDRRPLYYLAGGAALLILLIAGTVYYVRKRRKAAVPPPPPPLPWEVALEALDALEHGDVIDSGDPRTYCFNLSEIFRHYLEQRFLFPAMEETTEEILRSFRDVDVPMGRHRDLARELLTGTDWVKFAKRMPDEDESRQMLKTARDFVEATIPPPPPVAGQDGPAKEVS